MIQLTRNEFKEIYDMIYDVIKSEHKNYNNGLDTAIARGWIKKTALDEAIEEYKYLKKYFGDERIDHLYNLFIIAINEIKTEGSL